MRIRGSGTTGVAQGTVCNAQYTGTAVKASGDGSGWGSSSGCENQGSCVRQGATVDTGDSGSGKEWTAVAKAAVTQSSVVMRVRQCVAQSGLSHEGHWLAQEVALATAQAKTGEGRR